MMLTRAFAVFDVKADSYGTPFFQPSAGLAIRAFTDLVNDKNTVPGRHPGDFKLVELGSFDDSTGRLSSHEVPVSLGFGTDYIERGDSAPAIRKVS